MFTNMKNLQGGRNCFKQYMNQLTKKKHFNLNMLFKKRTSSKVPEISMFLWHNWQTNRFNVLQKFSKYTLVNLNFLQDI